MSFHQPMNLIELAGGMPAGTPMEMVERTYMECYARSSDVWDCIPWDTIEGCAKEVTFESCLPDFNIWRKYNQKPEGDWGAMDTYMEDMKLAQFNLPEIDHAMLMCPGEGAKRMKQFEMHMKTFGRKATDNFIFGTHADKDCPVGLRDRLGEAKSIYQVGDYSDRHFGNNYDPVSGLWVPGGLPLNMEVVRHAIDATDLSRGQAYWIMNKRLKSQIRAQRNDPNIDFDNRGTSIEDGKKDDILFCGIPIKIGYEFSDDKEFLPFDEVPMGGNDPDVMLPETTSMYLVVFGEDGVHGIRNHNPKLLQSGVEADDCLVWERMGYMDRWGYVVNKMSATRISGIRLGCITKDYCPKKEV